MKRPEWGEGGASRAFAVHDGPQLFQIGAEVLDGTQLNMTQELIANTLPATTTT